MSKLRLCMEESQLSLEWQMEKLALDVTGLQSAVNSFKEVIPSLADKIKEQASQLFDTGHENETVKIITEDKAIISKILTENSASVNLADFDKLLIVVPEGFNTTFLQALNTYTAIVPDVFKFVSATLVEYNFALASFITNKDNKITNKDHTNFYKKVTDTREEYVKRISKMYKDSDKTFGYFGNVVDRVADLEAISKEVAKLAKMNDAHNTDKLRHNVKQACELIDIVCKNASDSSVINISNVTINNLSVGAYEIAKLIEFVALMKFKIEQLTVAIQKTLTIVKESLKK